MLLKDSGSVEPIYSEEQQRLLDSADDMIKYLGKTYPEDNLPNRF